MCEGHQVTPCSLPSNRMWNWLSPRRRQSSLPSPKAQSLRTDRPAHPQGPAASSPRRHGRRRFRRRRPRTPSAPKPQIPTRTGPRRRRRSSGGFGPAPSTERPANRSASPGCRGPAAQHGLRRPWSATDSTCRPAPGRRRLGEPVRMLPRNQSPELATALGGRSRKAPDERGPRRRLPPAAPCFPPAVAIVRACVRSRPALPAGSVFAGSHPRLRNRVGFLPEIPGRRGRVPALMEPRRPHPLPVAALPASPRTGPSRLRHRVRMAETGPPGAARPVRPFHSHPGSRRSEPRPAPGPVNERRPAVKAGQRVGPGVPAGRSRRCM